jgi:chromate transporter
MSLLDLVALILTFNIITFGNGPVMIPLLQKALVEEERVLSVDQLLYAFTIARVTPGQANLYVAAIGYMLSGVVGAVATTLAVMLPSYLMLPLIRGYERFRTTRIVSGFTRGLVSTSVGLILAATVSIGLQTLREPISWAVFALALTTAYLLKWNPILSLVVASAAGLLLRGLF